MLRVLKFYRLGYDVELCFPENEYDVELCFPENELCFPENANEILSIGL
jgi:hypothetical protein